MRIQSNDIVILDTTDTKKIDLHITSNHPTVQISNSNDSQAPLTPDWSKSPLVLTPIIYIDAEPMTDDLDATFTWTMIKGNEANGTEKSKTKVLTISTNEDLDTSSTIRYKCEVQYNNKSFFNEITFARVSAGKDGASGSSAPAVKAQYSVDGVSDWSSILNEDQHKYIRLSYDNGATWPSVFKIAGEDGKSVQVKGVAYSKTTPVTGESITLYSDTSTNTRITSAIQGDSYLVDGYLCVYNGANFVCTGQIQGPQGAKGDSYYLFIRYADNTSGSGISTNPDGKSYIGFYRSSVNQVPTDVSSATWNWAKFVGEDAKSITLTSNVQVFKIDKSNTMTPATITVTAQATNTTISSSGWTYSVDGGKTFSATVPTGVARSGNVVTLTGASLTSNSIVIKASDGTYSDLLTIYKVFDGTDGKQGDEGKPAPTVFLTNENISFAANANGQIIGTTVYCNVVAYSGTTKVTPTIGTILSTEIPTGMTIGTTTTTSNEIVIPITIANNATLGSAQNVNGTINIPITSPVATSLKLTWSKINSGVNGTNASLVDITPSALYFKSTTGKDGTFTPDYIYLYPRFQTVSFSKWEYSVNGGTTWVAASGANGLTISTYNSIANALRIAKTSTLYTDTVTSISFRCVSSNAAVYDTVSIGKLFDVDVEEINTRITESLAEVKTTTDSITSRVSATEASISTINNNVSSITTRVSAAEQKITPTAIVSTVRQSTDYTNDLGKKVNSSEIISKINQTAESVTISAKKIGLLGATNIPDLTADKIKGGTLTLGGSNATTQSGQLLVKNASDTDMLKLNKDGIVVRSGHLAIAEDFANSRFDWETETWYTTTNTRQLDLGDTYIRMGVYSPSGYTNYMRLLDNGLYFSGNAQGLGSWGSFIGHSSGDFVIQDSVRSNILFRGHDGDEMASISSDGFYINGPVYGGITSGNAKQLNNVFVQHFSTAQTGYIAIRLGTATRSLNSMITIKGHVTSYQNSTSFEASCYFYKSNSVFHNPVATISNPDVLREVYFAEGISDGCVYLIIGSTNSAWNHPTVAIDTLTIGYSGHTAYEWNTGWIATVHTNLSNFQTVTPCHRGGMKKTLWSGAVKNGATITVNENIRNFKFLTCIIGEETSDLGIVLGTFLDDTLPQLHFGAIYTDTNGLAGNDLMGAKFRVNSETSLTLDGCASKFASTLHCKKIVGWR